MHAVIITGIKTIKTDATILSLKKPQKSSLHVHLIDPYILYTKSYIQ